MHRAFLFCMYWCAAHACAAHTAGFAIERVIDGDTVALSWPTLPAPLNRTGLRLRIRGVDCPESGGRARCAQERTLAAQATERSADFVRRLVFPVVWLCEWDKYGDGARFCGRTKGSGVQDGYWAICPMHAAAF